MNLRAKIGLAAMLFLSLVVCASAQTVSPTRGERILVQKGLAAKGVINKLGIDISLMSSDSLYRFMAVIDSLRGDGRQYDLTVVDSMLMKPVEVTIPDSLWNDSLPTDLSLSDSLRADSLPVDSVRKKIVWERSPNLGYEVVKLLMNDPKFLDLYISGADTLLAKLRPVDSTRREMTPRELRRWARDTSTYRYTKLFRDTIPFSKLIALSAIAPGLSQFYNQQYWKVPVFYSTVAAGLFFGFRQNTVYQRYKKEYDHIIAYEGSGRTDHLNTVQGKMIQHNTYRQLFFGAAIASYIYFLGDGAVNYPSQVNAVKKATTLSMICPGAGQVYNKSYWKLPFVFPGAASLIYCVDFNNRGYQRFKLAYELLTDGDDATQDEFNGRYSEDYLKNLKDSYRRNRDLCIILTAGFYILQVIDAHVDAHMKTYDISDDLSMSVEPYMENIYSQRFGRVSTLGFNINFKF